jgi:hypothetical protein
VDPRASLDDLEERKFLTLSVLELRPVRRRSRSQSLYRLRYHGSEIVQMKFKYTDGHGRSQDFPRRGGGGAIKFAYKFIFKSLKIILIIYLKMLLIFIVDILYSSFSFILILFRSGVWTDAYFGPFLLPVSMPTQQDSSPKRYYAFYS